MLLLILYILCIVNCNSLFYDVSNSEFVDARWAEYKLEHRLSYGEEENDKRKNIFIDNLKFINDHNEMKSTFTLGITPFTHMTYAEYLDFIESSSVKIPKTKKVRKNKVSMNTEIKDIDWREKGAVTNVKAQLLCGSSWAFSAVTVLEGQYYLKYDKLLSLSAKNLVDCSGIYGTYGCRGGFVENALEYVKQVGINSNDDYPYIPFAGTCLYNESTSVLKLEDYKLYEDYNETHLQALVNKIGPISVLFDTSGEKFRFYVGGIYQNENCDYQNLIHAMAVVGLSSDPVPHYIVKNCWGKSWGVDGYLLTPRNKDNMCGIASHYTYPILQ